MIGEIPYRKFGFLQYFEKNRSLYREKHNVLARNGSLGQKTRPRLSKMLRASSRDGVVLRTLCRSPAHYAAHPLTMPLQSQNFQNVRLDPKNENPSLPEVWWKTKTMANFETTTTSNILPKPKRPLSQTERTIAPSNTVAAHEIQIQFQRTLDAKFGEFDPCINRDETRRTYEKNHRPPTGWAGGKANHQIQHRLRTTASPPLIVPPAYSPACSPVAPSVGLVRQVNEAAVVVQHLPQLAADGSVPGAVVTSQNQTSTKPKPHKTKSK